MSNATATRDPARQVRADELSDLARLPRVHGRGYGRQIAVVLMVLAVAWLARAFAMGDIEWEYVGRFLTAESIMLGIRNTLMLGVAAMAVAIVCGVVGGTMATSVNPVARGVAGLYVWVFRGTPVLLQLFMWFNLALVFPTLAIPGLWEARTVEVITPFGAALLGLGLNQGAYVSEIVRSGLLSVDKGQLEAASSIGMTRLLALRRIVIPQAIRVIVPPLGNQFILLVKLTSLASITEFQELLYNARTIYYANSRVMELLIVAAIWYLVIVAVLTFGQRLLERRVSRGRA